MNVLLSFLLLLQPSDRVGITTLDEEYICIGKELATCSPPLLPTYHHEIFPDSIDWVLMDSFYFSGPLMNNTSFALCNSGWDITYSLSPETLSTLAQNAVAYAPLRFRNALTAAFFRLDTLQDFYAQLILNTALQRADEVVFQVCHIGPEILAYPGFSPNLLTINANLLYEIDDSLQYADIVDYSLPNGDYYSTVTYRVLEGNDSIWVELPWQIYYDYIVHPIISDEFPDMSAYVYSKFWREYLFYEADSSYPILGAEIKQAKILWDCTRVILPPGRPFTPDDCALDVIANWTTYTVPQAAQGNRPIQPNIIAHEHNGNCGELQDLLTAGARTCLVACVGTSDPCEDHVWSEFYDRGFYPYQVDLGFGVTHIADTNVAYDEQHGGSKRVSAIFDWRSDGYWWTVTGTYSNSCSLYVYVYDLMGRPIDGASVTIVSEGYYGGFSTSTRAYTDPEGYCCFELGDLRNFYARVSTPIGSYPVDPEATVQIIQNSQTGAKYYKVFCVANYMTAPDFSDTVNLNSLAVWKFEAILDSLVDQSRGGCGTRYGPGDSIIVSRSFYERYAKGNVDLLFVDDANFNWYIQGQEFKAFDFYPAGSGVFDFIAQDSASYHLIVSNEDVLYNTPFFDLRVNLYRNPAPGVEEISVSETNVPELPTIFRQKLSLQLSEPAQLKIYEVSGRLVYDSKREVDEIEKFLSAGIYFIRITGDKKNQIGKFVILK